MKRYVLDSYALIAYFEGEKGAETVAASLRMPLRTGLKYSYAW